jgi:hypothetical protein
LASASNSDRFCQISGLALESAVIDPSGNSFGISRAFIAIVSAFTAMPSMLPALNLACASLQLAPFSFISRWRSETISAALIFGALLELLDPLPAHPPYASALRVPRTMPALTAWRRFMIPLLVEGTARGCRVLTGRSCS